MDRAREMMPELEQLVGLFYARMEDLGHFEEVVADQTPEPFRGLLAHNEHMTVTVEKFHGCPVNVEVLAKREQDMFYSRKILLRRASDGQVVQFGIVRLNCSFLSDAAAGEIKSERIPLGRVLIQHNVLREVQLASLWKIAPGADLANTMNLDASQIVYGRTALIFCNGEPAVELLEIVTPD